MWIMLIVEETSQFSLVVVVVSLHAILLTCIGFI